MDWIAAAVLGFCSALLLLAWSGIGLLSRLR